MEETPCLYLGGWEEEVAKKLTIIPKTADQSAMGRVKPSGDSGHLITGKCFVNRINEEWTKTKPPFRDGWEVFVRVHWCFMGAWETAQPVKKIEKVADPTRDALFLRHERFRRALVSHFLQRGNEGTMMARG